MHNVAISFVSHFGVSISGFSLALVAVFSLVSDFRQFSLVSDFRQWRSIVRSFGLGDFRQYRTRLVENARAGCESLICSWGNRFVFVSCWFSVTPSAFRWRTSQRGTLCYLLYECTSSTGSHVKSHFVEIILYYERLTETTPWLWNLESPTCGILSHTH